MNHIYKSIFNKALGVFTAVPEFASAHGKGSERTVVGRVAKGTAGFAASALAISVGLALTSTSAVAGPGIYINDGTDTGCLAVPDAQGPNVGIHGISGGVPSAALSLLGPSQVVPDRSYYGLDVMKPCLSSTAANATEERSTQTNRTLFYGKNGPASVTDNGAKNLTLGGRLDVNSGIIGVGDRGTNGAGATNSIRMGTGTTLADANKKENAISIGVNTQATQAWATAIGANAVASGIKGSQAYGYDSVASGKSAIAQGYHSHADGQSAVAIGDNAKASGIATVSIGFQANGHSEDGDKDNTPSTTKASYGVAVGHFAGADYTGTDNQESTAVGNEAGRHGEGGTINTAVGSKAGQYVKGSQNIAMGHYAGSGDATNKLEASNTVSIGSFAKASANNAAAMGAQAAASGSNSAAIGLNAKAKTDSSIAIGTSSEAGGPATSAALLGTKAVAIGYETKALGTSNVALGYGSVAENGHDSIAIGIKTKTSNVKSIAIGAYSEASGAQSTVISNNYGSATAVSTASGTRSQVYGAETNVSGNNSVAIGDTNNIESARTYALGNNINAAAGTNDSLAFGTKASVGGANAIALGNTAKATKENTIAQGTESVVYGKNSVSIGYKAVSGIETPTPTQTNAFSVSIGNETEAIDASTIAIGDKAKAKGGVDALAVGTQANAMTYKALAIGAYSQATGRQSTVIGNDIQGQPSIASGTRSQILGVQSNVSGDNSVSIGDTNTVASARTYALGNNINAAAGTDDSLAFGTRASVQGANTIAVGNTAQALTDDSISIGRDSKAGKVDKFDGKKSIAIGYASEAMGSNAIALGSNAATNNGHDSIAMGTYAKTNGEKTISIGAYNTAEGAQSIVIAGNYDASTGSNRSTTTAAAKRAIVVGPESHATAEDAVAIGNKNTIASARTYAMGNNINVAAGADDSLAFGTRAHVSGANQVSIGTDAGADNTSAGEGNTAGISIGNDAGRYATAGKNNTSIGQRAGQYANGDNNVAIGKDAGSLDAAGAPLTTNTVSIGSSSKVKGQEAIAVGNEAEAISNSAIAIGNSAKGRALYSTAIGLRAKTSDDATMTFGESATAVGHAAAATRYSAAAFGHDSFADGESSVALGYAAKALGTEQIAIGAHAGQNRQGTQTGANFSVAIGRSAGGDAASALGNHSGVSVGLDAGRYLQDGSRNTAVGGYAGQYVKGSYNVALGHGAGSGTATEHLEASETISIGHNSKASAAYSTAIGTNANAAQANSVALGAGSTTSDVHTGDYTLNGSYTAAGLPKVANGTVSVGAVGKERQIQNVAAGVISATSTDAINGSQLYATNNYLSNLAGGVKNVLGGDAAVDNAGNVTMSNIGGTGKGNVNDAIAAANTKVAAGNNITVTPTTNADGSKTYTVATTKDLVVDSVKAGDTTVNKDGVTIAGGPSVKKDGINAGDKKITGVADGNVAAGSTDAVNGGQLAEVKAKADSAVQDVVSSNPTALTANKVGNTVTLTPNFIAGDLVNADGTVNTPATADEGKLVSAKTVADALKANHFVVDTKANGGAVDAASEENAKVGSGNKVTFEAGKNLVAQQTNTANGGATVNYKLSDTLENLVSVKSAEIEAGIGPNKVVLNNNGVKVGDSTLNDKGLTINNGPSVTDTGIDAGNKKITGVADGNVAAGSTDAVNGGQLAAVKAKADTAVQDIKSGDENALTAVKDPNTNIVTVTPKLSGDLVDANGNITAPTTPADKGKLVTAGTVAEALANTHFVVDTKATDGELDAASQADQKIKASNKVTLQAGKNLKAKQTNGANGAEVEFSLKDSISLKEVKVGEGSANEVVLNNNGVNVAGNTYINKDGLNANDKKITNVAPGAVTAASKDAVNGSQLYNVANNVKDLIGPDAAIDPATGKVTVADPAKGIGETGKGNIGDAIKHVNDAAKAAAETAAKHTTVVEGKNVKVTKGKNAAGGDEYTVATKDDLDVTSVTAGNTTVNTNGLTITGGPSVTRGGIDAGNRIISGVKAGDVSATSQEAVNGSQLHATNTKLDGVKAKADTAVQDVKSGDENALTAVKDPNTNIVTVTPKLSGDLVDANGNITAPTTPADKGKLVTAGTVADALANTHFVVDTKATDGELDAASQADQKIKAGNKVTLQAGKNLKAKQTNGANGAQVEFSLKDSISLKEVTAGEGANQVVLGNDGVKVGGNTYINNAGLNANGNKITNVADGVDPKDAVNKGQLDAVKGVADSAVKSVDVANGEQNLVVDNSDPKNPKLSLKKDLTVDSVKAGDSTLNNDGLTIAGGPSVKKDGINAGDKTITNVAPGAVTPTSKDAVNGGQLYNVANNVKDLIGPDATIDPATGKVTVADPAKGIGETGKGNIGDAIKHVNDAAKAAADTAKKHTTVEQGDNILVEESLNADGGKHYKVSTARDLNVDSVKAGDTTVNNDGVTIAGGPSVTKAGINAGGNTITNVADGVNPNDAVNKGQLDAVKGVADSAVKSVDVANGEQNLVVDNSDPKNPKLSLKKDLTVDSVKAGDSTLNNDGLTIAGGPSVTKDGINAGDKKITNVAAGDVAENSKDAVNGGQLYDVAKNVADLVGPDAKIDPATGKVTVTDPAKGIGETGKGNIGDAIKHVNDLAKNAADTAKKHTTVEQGDNIVVEESTNAEGGKHYKVSTAKNLNVDSVKAGDTTVNNDGVTIAGGPSVTKGGINAGGNTITNVADGVNPDDAVNKGQLDKVDTKVSNVAQNVVNVLGGDAAVNGNGDITMSNIGETGKGNINDAIKSVNDLAKKAAAEKTSVKAKEGRSNVTVTEGVNAAGGHEYTVDVERAVTEAGSDQVTVTSKHDADSNTTTYTVDVSDKTKASLAKADSAVQGLTSKDGNLNFNKDPNGNVEVSFNDNLNVKNVTTDRVQVANGPSMSKDGINAAGKAISNVANGNVAADSKDAVNGGQLYDTAKSVADVIGGGATVKDGKVVAGQNGIGNTGQNTVHGAIAAINQNTANNFNQIRGDLRKMDRDLRGGIAGALATAGLPQAFRPGKSMVAAAASTYRGQSGLAIGVSRISDNGKVILKVTGNTNSRGDFGGTIGAGYQW